MSELDRVIEETCSDEPSGVSHIDEEDSPDLICDLTDTLVVPFARVSRAPCDDELRLVLESTLLHLIVVYTTRFLADIVVDSVIEKT